MNRAKRVPTSAAGEGIATPDNVHWHYRSSGAGGNQANTGLCFGEVSVCGSGSFRKKNKSSLVLKDFKNIFQGGRSGGFLVDGNRSDGGK